MKKSVPIQSIELAMAAPQVVAHRLIRLSSVQPSSDAYHECYRMWSEKVVGFGESWNAMFFEVIRYQQKMLTTVAANWLTPWMVPHAVVKSAIVQTPLAGEEMARKGLTPIQRKAVANKKRLSHAKKKRSGA